ncbi:unnamed protein product [Bursaphelenchus okinawaensis]|uniref:receptor protein-tyrosine kinase n=1 Tax=Bursaphelenchus okinawaensis TaxID=465554 RepID=A0A811LRH8_9BILA|nr:unnamed protein product [Bursaphelenchus okinawaensis]CAG9128350.1 unnamed protein product [Bursaphelenchus okinawaensis]
MKLPLIYLIYLVHLKVLVVQSICSFRHYELTCDLADLQSINRTFDLNLVDYQRLSSIILICPNKGSGAKLIEGSGEKDKDDERTTSDSKKGKRFRRSIDVGIGKATDSEKQGKDGQKLITNPTKLINTDTKSTDQTEKPIILPSTSTDRSETSTTTQKSTELSLEKALLTYYNKLNTTNLERLSVVNCNVDIIAQLPKILGYHGLQFLNLSNNNINEFSWQQGRQLAAGARLELRNNPLNCSCKNSWLLHLQHQHTETYWSEAQILQLPLKITVDSNVKTCLDQLKCEEEQTIVRPALIETKTGAEANINCQFSTEIPNYDNLTDSDYDKYVAKSFFWLFDREKSEIDNREGRIEIYSNNSTSVSLRASNLTSEELGMIVCQCNHCQGPSYGTAELRFETPLSAIIHSHGKDVELAVHGFPLANLTLKVTKESSNKTEVHNLSDQSTMFFNGTFITNFESDHSFDFLKYYRIYIKECALCRRSLDSENAASNYQLEICSNVNCAVLESDFGRHRGAIPTNLKPVKSTGQPSLLHRIITNIFFLLVATFLGTVFYFVYKKRRKPKKKATEEKAVVNWSKNSRIRRPSKTTMSTEETSLRDESICNASISHYSLQHVPTISKEHLIIEKKIGGGAFGDVFQGEWLVKNVPVAIKMLHNVQVDAQMDKEAGMLAELDHPNVVKMFGVCRMSDRNLAMVLELMNRGDLKTYVSDRRPKCDNYSQFPPALIRTELIDIARQVCTGLAYISSQQIVHRDLAARNCLVSGDTDIRVCNAAFRPAITVKISDFGMSRRLYSHAEYYRLSDKQTALPVRWLPPECVNSGKFTTMSDIWAFGVLLYEIFSFGDTPYGDLSNNEALVAVLAGIKPEIPKSAPEAIKEVMAECYNDKPEERPVAEDLLIRFKEMH